jgi:hypothetical protein
VSTTVAVDDDAVVPAVRKTRRAKAADAQALHRIEALERERDELRAENERLRVAVEYRITREDAK